MNTSELADTLTALLSELVDGAPEAGAYVLNPGDGGLLRSLDRLSASAASASTQGGADRVKGMACSILVRLMKPKRSKFGRGNARRSARCSR